MQWGKGRACGSKSRMGRNRGSAFLKPFIIDGMRCESAAFVKFDKFSGVGRACRGEDRSTDAAPDRSVCNYQCDQFLLGRLARDFLS
jgi:hypothetical protein